MDLMEYSLRARSLARAKLACSTPSSSFPRNCPLLTTSPRSTCNSATRPTMELASFTTCCGSIRQSIDEDADSSAWVSGASSRKAQQINWGHRALRFVPLAIKLASPNDLIRNALLNEYHKNIK